MSQEKEHGDTSKIPPRSYKSSLVCKGHKETAASFFQSRRFSNGRVNRAAARRLFFFCRRPADNVSIMFIFLMLSELFLFS